MTAQVLQIRPAAKPSAKPKPKASTVTALANQTKAAWDRADQKKADSDAWFIRTGKLLIKLKKECGRGKWLPTLKRLGDRSARRAQELMEAVGDTEALDKQRERKREHARKVAKSNARYSAHLVPDDEPDDDPGDPPEVRWQNSLAHYCSEVIAMQAYWTQQFPGWEKFDAPSHIVILAADAAAALASVAKTVNRK